MSATASAWGPLTEPTDSRWTQQPETKTLRPYRVRYDGELYSQEDFLTTDTRYHNFTSGIGAGKTLSGILRVAANVEAWNPGETGMIVAPTVPALKNVILPELRKWNFLNDWEYYGPQSERPGLHAPNGARILLESANNERKIGRLRGPSIAWFWIDEAAQVPARAWDILTGRLREGNYRNGFITTTPRGYNWVYDTFVDPETQLDSVTNVLGVPSHANPHNPHEYQDIVEDYSGRFYEQEALGRFVQFEGLVYPWFSETDHVVSEHPDTIRRVFYGVDWGHNAPSVILAIGETATNQLCVLEEFYESRCTVNDLVQVAEDMQDSYRPGQFYCDPAEPASIETFQRAGLDALPAENDVLPGIQHISSIQDRLTVHESCQNLINEFGMYRYKDGGDDEAPVKVNDHAMDAGRYALFTDEKQGGLNVGVGW